MDIKSIIEDINEKMDDMVATMYRSRADGLGLDRRAAYLVYVDQDCVIVPKDSDRSMQYYGGFEYIDPEYRTEIGNYVVYLGDCDRVSEAIEYFMNSLDKE